MDTLFPDFSQATFESGQPVDNQYFPLTPGTVLFYQGELYDIEEIALYLIT